MSVLRRGALGAFVLVLACNASAAPHFSGPSLLKRDTPTEFQGKGFAPNSAVTVVIASAKTGAAASHGAVVGPDGQLRYTVTPHTEGVHTLTVTDSGGRQLVTVDFNVAP
jgi:hypothetical protein